MSPRGYRNYRKVNSGCVSVKNHYKDAQEGVLWIDMTHKYSDQSFFIETFLAAQNTFDTQQTCQEDDPYSIWYQPDIEDAYSLLCSIAPYDQQSQAQSQETRLREPMQSAYCRYYHIASKAIASAQYYVHIFY